MGSPVDTFGMSKESNKYFFIVPISLDNIFATGITRSIYCSQNNFLMPCSFSATVLVSFSVALITSRLTKNPAVVIAFK